MPIHKQNFYLSRTNKKPMLFIKSTLTFIPILNLFQEHTIPAQFLNKFSTIPHQIMLKSIQLIQNMHLTKLSLLSSSHSNHHLVISSNTKCSLIKHVSSMNMKQLKCPISVMHCTKHKL